MNKTIYLSIILISVTFLSSKSGVCQSRDHDERLIGKWTILFFKDADGKLLKNGFQGKNYVDTFFENGQYSIDPNFFRDEAKKNGINEPIDYSSIPSFSWKTVNNQILSIETGQGSQEIRYGFLGDTLIFGYPNGHTRYLLKRK
ncbi:hypothetical protein [Algoriphagus sp.]|uniref:hypothetical protein n=1 Tax=Algoriphagus sp. TaxID=1872435 RepID=UPI002628FF64|nr:hypothetical protein [Algoriphagus sp.]